MPVAVQKRTVLLSPRLNQSSDNLGSWGKGYGVVATFFFAFGGCFWALPFTVLGVAFGIIVSKLAATLQDGYRTQAQVPIAISTRRQWALNKEDNPAISNSVR